MEKMPLRPTTAKERHVVLDALRGLALLGIALANFPEFALWTFLSADEQSAMPTAGVDRIVRFLQYMLVDGGLAAGYHGGELRHVVARC